MKKAFLVLFLATACCLASPEKKVAEPERPAPRELVRDPASDVDGTVQLYYVDGWRVMDYSFDVPNTVGTSRGAVRIEADPKAGTFKMTREEPAEMPSWLAIDTEVDEKAAPDLPEPPDPCPCDGGECSGNVIAWATTYDPLGIEMTKTSAAGGWRRKVDYITRTCKWQSTGATGYCTPYNPTAAGTHWYNAQPCSKTGPFAYPDGYWEMSALGQYKNLDWMAPLIYTYVQDMIKPSMEFGQLHIAGTHGDQGEGAELLFALPNYTLVNSCNR